MPFFFTAGHYRVAWLVVGALLVHAAWNCRWSGSQ
jgi:hypothetical protein